MKRYDLMQKINGRGTFLASKTCVPYLKKAENPHILMLSPPLDLNPRWFAPHVAYTISKYNMSLCVLGLSAELKRDGIAVNALWPRTTIATAAIANLLGGDKLMRASRKADILADAAHVILTKPSREFTGKFCIDDTLLWENGRREFDHYRIDPSEDLGARLFCARGQQGARAAEGARQQADRVKALS